MSSTDARRARRLVERAATSGTALPREGNPAWAASRALLTHAKQVDRTPGSSRATKPVHAVAALAVGADVEGVWLVPKSRIGVRLEPAIDDYQLAVISWAGPLHDFAAGLVPSTDDPRVGLWPRQERGRTSRSRVVAPIGRCWDRSPRARLASGANGLCTSLQP